MFRFFKKLSITITFWKDNVIATIQKPYIYMCVCVCVCVYIYMYIAIFREQTKWILSHPRKAFCSVNHWMWCDRNSLVWRKSFGHETKRILL